MEIFSLMDSYFGRFITSLCSFEVILVFADLPFQGCFLPHMSCSCQRYIVVKGVHILGSVLVIAKYMVEKFCATQPVTYLYREWCQM